MINHVLGHKKTKLHQDYIIHNSELISDESDKAAACRSHFENWFKALPDDGTHVNNDVHDPNFLYGSFQDFKYNFHSSQIPEDILLQLFNSIQTRPTKGKVEYIQSELKKPPSFEEFTEHLKRSHNNSSPGYSLLSYNMIKLWPQQLLLDMFNLLDKLWEADDLPDEWLQRVITPLSPTCQT